MNQKQTTDAVWKALMTQPNLKDYIVPVTDDDGQAQYVILRRTSVTSEEATDVAREWIERHPGWKISGEAIVPIPLS
jgi:hypothetical protein